MCITARPIKPCNKSMAACYLLPSSKSADCRPFNTDSPHLNINDYLYTSPNLSDNVYIIECLNVFSELLGIFGGLIILAYQNCQIFTFSPPPPKKRSTTCAYFGTKRSRYQHFGSKRSRYHHRLWKFCEGIQEVKFITVTHLYNAKV